MIAENFISYSHTLYVKNKRGCKSPPDPAYFTVNFNNALREIQRLSFAGHCFFVCLLMQRLLPGSRLHFSFSSSRHLPIIIPPFRLIADFKRPEKSQLCWDLYFPISPNFYTKISQRKLVFKTRSLTLTEINFAGLFFI